MIKKNILIIFVALTFFSSCAMYIHLLEERDDYNLPPSTQPETQCEIVKEINFASSNTDLNNLFEELSNKKFKNMSIVELATLFAFAQISSRPDMSSPTSSTTIIAKIDNKDFSISSFSENTRSTLTTAPYFSTLEKLLSFYNSKNNIIKLATLFDSTSEISINVDQEFEEFLNKFQNEIAGNENIRQLFFKADHPLIKGDKLKKHSVAKIVTTLNMQKIINTSSVNDITYQNNARLNLNYKCNNISPMASLIPQKISSKEITGNAFSVYDNKGNFVFIYSYQELFKPLTTLSKNLLVFTGTDNQKQEPGVCHISNSLIEGDTTIISMDTRDPKQLLFNLFAKKESLFGSSEGMDKLINTHRFLLLDSPKRLLIETNRMQKTDIRYLLQTTKHKIEHYSPLGKIWAFIKYPEKKESGLITDSRYLTTHSCNKN